MTLPPLPMRVLLVEDEPDDAELALAELRRAGYAPESRRVHTEAGYLEALQSAWDLILTDYHLPQFDGLRVLELWRESGLDVPVILITGALGEEAAVECIKRGAADYLLKDRLGRLGPAVQRALEEKRLRDEQRQAQKALQRYAERLRILHEIDSAILSARSPEEVAAVTLARIRDVIPCQRASVVLFDFESQQATPLAVAPEAPAGASAAGSRPMAALGTLADLEAGRPHIVPDLQARAQPSPAEAGLLEEGIRAHMSVPLINRGKLIGALNVDAAEADAFDAEHVEIAGETAAQLAIALQQARLLNETQQRVQELQGLQQVAKAFGSLTDIHETFGVLAEQIARVIGAQKCVVMRHDPDDMLRARAPGYGLSDADVVNLQWPLKAPLAPEMRAYLDRGWLMVNRTDDLPRPYRQLAKARGVASLLAVPLWIEREFGGQVLVANKPGGFTPDDVRLLTVFASQAAVVMEKARLFDETRQRAAELEVLAEASSILRQAQTHDDMVPLVMQFARQALQASAGVLLLLEADTLIFAAGHGPAEAFVGRKLGLSNSLLWQVARTGQSLYSQDLGQEQLFGSDDIVHGLLVGMPSYVFIPLKTAEATVGLLGLAWRSAWNASETDRRLLTAIAEIAGNALHRSGIMNTLERRVAERTRELEQANERLTELDKLKDLFVSNVSHELRTPLTNITLYLSLLEKRGADELARSIPLLKRESRRLNHLIEDLLTLSRLEQGRMVLMQEPHVLDGLLAEVAQAHAARAENKELLLTHDLNPDAPPVPVDAGQMMQVFTNLVGNAVAYTPAGGRIAISSELQRRDADAGLVIRFYNDGPPIPPEDMPNLFERFYRGQTGHESGEPGTGLGLAICREIVERHRGQIYVESQAGEGTTFTIWLPLEAR